MKSLTSTRKTLLSNFFSLSILQATNYLLPLITVPYLLRVLGPDRYGAVSFALAFVQYFIILTDYGFNLSATQKIANCRDDVGELSSIFWRVMAIKALLLLLSFILMVGLILIVPRLQIDFRLFFYSFGLVVGTVLFPVWLFQGLEKMRYITYINIVSRLLLVITTFTIIKTTADYFYLPLLYSASWVLSGALGLIVALSSLKIRWFKPTLKAMNRELADGWHVFASSINISIYTNSVTFILGLFASNEVVGYFASADKLRYAIQSGFQQIFTAVYPYVTKVANESPKRLLDLLRKETLWVGGFSACIAILLYFTSPLIVTVLFGDQYLPSIPILRILSFVPIFFVLGNILTVQGMLSLNLKKEYLRVYLASSLLGIVALPLLAYYYAAEGISFGILLVEMCVVGMTVHYLKKNKINLLRKNWFVAEANA